MKKMPFVRGVSYAAYIVFRIMSVLSLVGAIALLISVFALSVMPASSVSADVSLGMEMKVNFSKLYGEDWESRVANTTIPEGFEKTEDGVQGTQTETVALVENRGFALALIPILAEMLTLFVFYRCLANATNAVKNAPPFAPFSSDLAKEVKTAGIVAFFLAAGPAVCSGLIGIMTLGKQTFSLGETDIDMTLVLWGFVLLALSHLFEHAASLQPAPDPMPFGTQQNPPFDGQQNPPSDGAF